jgi:hypothetical protein
MIERQNARITNWELDPVVRSLLDTDFYKLLMLQIEAFSQTRVLADQSPCSVRTSSTVKN